HPPCSCQCLCRIACDPAPRFHLSPGSAMKEQRFVREVLESKQRILMISFVVGAIFFLLLLRLWHLQILNVEDYRNMSENNRLRFVPVAASRGAIMDKRGK